MLLERRQFSNVPCHDVRSISESQFSEVCFPPITFSAFPHKILFLSFVALLFGLNSRYPMTLRRYDPFAQSQLARLLNGEHQQPL